jgi:Contractile injection system tube protein
MEIASLTLLPLDAGVPPIKVQMNPTDLKRKGGVKTKSNLGANNRGTGAPRQSFAEKTPITFEFTTIFDNYESGRNVEEDLKPLHKALEFIKELRRTPVYEFRWGTQIYLRRCFVENFDYQHCMYAPDGTPLRSAVYVFLKEADDPNAQNQANQQVNPSQADRTDPSNQNLFASLLSGWGFFT